MNAWQLLGKYCAHCVEESTGGLWGNPMLQVGGEQEAVTDPAPGDEGVAVQDRVHPVLTGTTAGCEEVQVRGILLRTIPLPLLSRELLPITSVTVAMIVSEDPLVTENVVCCDPTWPNSSVMFWMGQVSKKSNTTGIGFWL